MSKSSTKYQLLKSDFEQACRDLKQRKEMIEKLKKEKEQAYYNGYMQGRFDEKMSCTNELGMNPQNLTSMCLKCGVDLRNCICYQDTHDDYAKQGG
ncbi:hypothetical protein [Pontibacillus salipaludis]|uniref:Coil containing protein n=1 Tax=Pontibacillus salipaludis TaxID=1697394 RepID=A0ABQ1PWA0_9BACI|nr:hypothetical protein [Pontibacillus salipaludis]GGD05247.1 hypothetical protein GCM10011389_10950 [Pontibacillus salipaludis]